MMEAFYFGENEQLLGMYHEANPDCERHTGIVLCNPLGQEYMRSYKAIRNLAIALANIGYDVLRFDYVGTGDSFGDEKGVVQSDLLENIIDAISELEDSCGVQKVVLIGLRFGAALSAMMSSHELVEKLVLWNPVLNGSFYLKELSDSYNHWLKGAFAKHKTNTDCFFESHGFTINKKLYEEISKFDISQFVIETVSDLLIIDHEDNKAAGTQLQAKNTVEFIGSMNEEFWIKKDDSDVKGLVPLHEINAIVNWLK